MPISPDKMLFPPKRVESLFAIDEAVKRGVVEEGIQRDQVIAAVGRVAQTIVDQVVPCAQVCNNPDLPWPLGFVPLTYRDRPSMLIASIERSLAAAGMKALGEVGLGKGDVAVAALNSKFSYSTGSGPHPVQVEVFRVEQVGELLMVATAQLGLIPISGKVLPPTRNSVEYQQWHRGVSMIMPLPPKPLSGKHS